MFHLNFVIPQQQSEYTSSTPSYLQNLKIIAAAAAIHLSTVQRARVRRSSRMCDCDPPHLNGQTKTSVCSIHRCLFPTHFFVAASRRWVGNLSGVEFATSQPDSRAVELNWHLLNLGESQKVSLRRRRRRRELRSSDDDRSSLAGRGAI